MSLRKLHNQVKTNKISLQEAINQAYKLGSKKLSESTTLNETTIIKIPLPTITIQTPCVINIGSRYEFEEYTFNDINFSDPNIKWKVLSNWGGYCFCYKNSEEFKHYDVLHTMGDPEDYMQEKGIYDYELQDE